MIVSIGEIVWDYFPGGNKVLGGAPVNVAYHLNALGLEVLIITRIGEDAMGRETLAVLSGFGLPLAGVQQGGLPTGVVRVMIEENEPRFDIVFPSAWDAIDKDEAHRVVGNGSFDLVYGTLAQRSAATAEAVRSLWKLAERRFYDVNLRPPFTTPELVADSLHAADLAKMNADELLTLGKWFDCVGVDKKDTARALAAKFTVPVIAVTEGKNGAWVLAQGKYFEAAGIAVEVKDTVGAGDAFFAALIEGYVTGRPWPETLDRANRRGGYVASRNGATPAMDMQDCFINI